MQIRLESKSNHQNWWGGVGGAGDTEEENTTDEVCVNIQLVVTESC